VIPVVVAGLLLKSIIESQFREPWIIGAATIFFGLVLWQADWTSKRERNLSSITLKDAIIVGLAQILALIPGTSRSGITMTAGLWVGLTREASSRFSFLLAIPTVLASSALITFDLLETTEAVDWNAIALGVVLSAISAYLCIHYFLKFIERIGMWPFVLYRLALGAFIFYLIA
jgi:undecaprenyl-diphosphatase